MYVLIDGSNEPSNSRYIGIVFSRHKTLSTATDRYVQEAVRTNKGQTEDLALFIFFIPSRVSKGDRILKRRHGLRFEAEAILRAQKAAREKSVKKSVNTKFNGPEGRGAAQNDRAEPVKRGRPPKRDSEKLSAHIGIAVTERERLAMEAAAKTLQKTLSEYIRWLHANDQASRGDNNRQL